MFHQCSCRINFNLNNMMAILKASAVIFYSTETNVLLII